MNTHESSSQPWLLQLSEVTVTRGETRILDRMSLTIPTSQHTAILGPNGSGKTSLLKVLNRQFYPSVDEGQTGSVQIFGRSTWNVADLRRHLGIVSGELDSEFAAPRSGRMTGLEAVLSGLDGVQLVSRISSLDDASVEAARQSLLRCGAADLEHQTLATMSTGQRRRVLIARALVHCPAALILDEPTTGLDIAARHRFLDLIQELAESGTTILLVTHHIEEIFPAIQRCIFLKGGRVYRDDACERLLRDEPLSDLFGFPVSVRRSAESQRYSLLGQ
ncbi:MAG: ABC transporter ATP-binding protein [Planctomycetaceae bacterium]